MRIVGFGVVGFGVEGVSGSGPRLFGPKGARSNVAEVSPREMIHQETDPKRNLLFCTGQVFLSRFRGLVPKPETLPLKA